MKIQEVENDTLSKNIRAVLMLFHGQIRSYCRVKVACAQPVFPGMAVSIQSEGPFQDSLQRLFAIAPVQGNQRGEPVCQSLRCGIESIKQEGDAPHYGVMPLMKRPFKTPAAESRFLYVWLTDNIGFRVGTVGHIGTCQGNERPCRDEGNKLIKAGIEAATIIIARLLDNGESEISCFSVIVLQEARQLW